MTGTNDHLENTAVGAPVVIRSAALIACLGTNRRAVWEAVKAGRCGTVPLTEIESPLLAGAVGGQAPALSDENQGEACREVRYLRRALNDVLTEAEFSVDAGTGKFQLPYPSHRCAIVLGTTLHGIRQGGAFLRTGDPEHLRRFLGTSVLHEASRGLGLNGPALTTCSACSSSLGAIALGITLLQSGLADLVVAGGYDPISEYAYAGFNSLRLIAPSALRPFARDRAGMKLGEGYGLVILERDADAQRRGGKILSRILGYGESADAHHLTQPHPQGAGAARAMTAALRVAGLSPTDINLIAAHATGTPDNDAAEYAALSGVFGPQLPKIPVVAFKSHLSHTLGGAGAVELILSAMALSEQIVPPCANVNATDTDFPGLNLSVGESRPAPLRHSMNLSLGFGGANTCMILGPVSPPPPLQPAGARRDVVITGVGVVSPGAIGNHAFIERLMTRQSERVVSDSSAIDDDAIAQILSARRVRRMSGYVKLSLAAAVLAMRDAGVAENSEFAEHCSALLGSTHGGARFCQEYYSDIVRAGIPAANPMLFAEGVPNAAAAHLSLATGIKGGCQTIIGSRTSGLDALGLAAARIASGRWDRAIVAAADEYSPMVNAGYAHCGVYAPREPALPFSKARTFVAGWGSAALVLESRESFLERSGRRIWGDVKGYAAGSGEVHDLPRTTNRILAELSDPPAILSSANGTWLDQAEDGAMRRSGEVTGCKPLVSSLCGHIAECFSAAPLAGIVAVLLSGRLPRLFGAAPSDNQDAPVERFASLATDYNGLAAGVCINRQTQGRIDAEVLR